MCSDIGCPNSSSNSCTSPYSSSDRRTNSTNNCTNRCTDSTDGGTDYSANWTVISAIGSADSGTSAVLSQVHYLCNHNSDFRIIRSCGWRLWHCHRCQRARGMRAYITDAAPGLSLSFDVIIPKGCLYNTWVAAFACAAALRLQILQPQRRLMFAGVLKQ